jgi:protein RecA
MLMSNSNVDRLIDELNKKYTPEGAKLPVVAKSENRPQQMFVPCTSPSLGFALGTGGWPIGHLSEFFGKEHAGKTTLMMLALKDCYEYYDGKRDIAFIDIEHRYNEEWSKLLGLPGNMIVVQPTSAEQATDIMQTLIHPKTGEGVCAIGFDSIGAAASTQEFDKFGDREYTVGRTAIVMTRNVRTMAPLANLYNTSVFYTNQLRADMQGYNRPITPGGYAIKHMMSMRVYLWPNTKDDSKRKDKIDGQEVQVGFEMNFRVVKNTFGPPGREAKSTFFFRPSRLFDGVGFDIDGDIEALGLMTGVVERKGSFYEYDGIKVLGREPFFAKLKAEDKYDALYKTIQEHLLDKFSTMFKEQDDRGQAFVDINDPEV